MTQCFDTAYGRMGAEFKNGKLVRVLLPKECGGLPDSGAPRDAAVGQIQEYLSGARKTFSLDTAPEGTEFQLRVWEVLRGIPYGKTVTYGELAAKLGKPKAYRAVGLACGRNPIPLIIPCHRVVGANGLTGFRGGLDMKKRLLQMENAL
jgi:methylated-DNA-[protein]-cysteine S-methyltransferase